MKGQNAEDIISEANSTKDELLKDSEEIVEWFIENQGELYTRDDAIEYISNQYGLSDDEANMAIVGLIDDMVDPVQQVSVAGGGKYVGVIGYEEYPSYGAYRYVDHHDVHGKRQRIVCSRCVNTSVSDAEVKHATQGEGTVSMDASISDMLDKVVNHYKSDHDSLPDDIEVGASLVSGTTIDGNTAFHAGNDGPGSNLDADTVDGSEAADLGAPSSTQNQTVTTGLNEINDLDGAVENYPDIYAIFDEIRVTNNGPSTFDVTVRYVDADTFDTFAIASGATEDLSLRNDVISSIRFEDGNLGLERVNVRTVPTHSHSL